MCWWLIVVLQLACVLQTQATEDNITLDDALLQNRADIQYNRLSLVTRYAGTGYNLIRGNPEGDFNYGGVDPGIKTTNNIFAHTYTRRKRAFYLGKTMQVPDQVNFHMSHSCAASHTVQAYSGRKSYMKELETSVSVSGIFLKIIIYSVFLITM